MSRLPILTIAALLLVGCSGSSSPTAPSTTQPVARANRVEYRVTGLIATTAHLTYANASGGTSQAKVNLPWSFSFTAASGQFLYLSAQNDGPVPGIGVSGIVYVDIYLDGVAWKRSSASGDYAIATVSGSAP